MSSTLTSELDLYKAVPGTAEPFRTTDINSNMDKIDAFAVATLAQIAAPTASVIDGGTA
jgi:hypothetical protein